MDSRNEFAALEAMCREKAALAKKEMEYCVQSAEVGTGCQGRQSRLHINGNVTAGRALSISCERAVGAGRSAVVSR
jgi:hypothetical protein